MLGSVRRHAVSTAMLPPRLAVSALALLAGSVRPHVPGSEVALRASALALAGVGVVPAAVGSILPVPRLPGSNYAAAAVSTVNYQPWLRRRIAQTFGRARTDFVIDAATSATDLLTYAPVSLGVDLGLRTLLLREALAARDSRRACGAEETPERIPSRDTAGPGERYAERAAGVQLAAGGVLAAVSAGGDSVANGIRVTAPRPLRMSREGFAAALATGLWRAHGIAVCDRAALRKLDGIDAVLVDPRVLFTEQLTVADIRGVPDAERVPVWTRALADLGDGVIGAGRHRIDGGAEVVVRPMRQGLAESLLGEIHAAGVDMITVDDDALGSLRSGFDQLVPLQSTVEDSLREALSVLAAEGKRVAVVSGPAIGKIGIGEVPGADTVRIGVLGARACAGQDAYDRSTADVWTDLAGAWRVMHALPAARTATRRGIELSAGASALGALVMLPGIRGSGPGPVSAGSLAGLWAGYAAARSVVRAPDPERSSYNSWHELDLHAVRRELAALVPSVTPHRRRRLALPAPLALAIDGLSAVRKELADPLTPVLAGGSAASAVLGSPVDAVLVGAVLVGNATMSAVQRLHSERAIRRLLRTQDPLARRVRGGTAQEVRADELVVGDVVDLRPGDVVPADGRLVSVESLEIDESSLTGESLPVDKQTGPTPAMPLAERACMAYAGTSVLAGSGRIVVTATGTRTESRRVDVSVRRSGPDVGLTSRLRELTRTTLPASVAGGALVTLSGLLRGSGLRQAVTGGVAVAVAAVPEGLPLVATLAQQASARRLGTAGVLVRSPRSIEALGRVDVVCFDKTGTLSENRLRVAAVERVDGWSEDEILEVAARSALARPGDEVFHSTDSSIVTAARHVLTAARVFDGESARAMVPFRSGRPYSAALVGRRIALKGSPEFVAAASTDARALSVQRVHDMARRGLRVVAVASRELSEDDARRAAEDSAYLERCCSSGLEPLGLLGLADTLRPEAIALVREVTCRGIGVRLLTGDHPSTAAAVATTLGVSVENGVVSGPEWETLSRSERHDAVRRCTVFARMTPEHKVEIVQILEADGRVCAMVGDGANDAAAIRVSSVGIGVASADSDPARGAADIVLLHGRVGGLTDALDEGRRLWQRVRSAVGVLLGGNAGEVAFALIGSALSGASPLGTRQLLLVNLMTDALPAAALAVSTPSTGGVDESNPLAGEVLWRTIAVRGGATALGALAAWMLARVSGRRRRASTVALVALVGTQLGQTLLESRSPLVVATAAGSALTLAAVVSTPVVSQFLGCTPLGPIAWGQALGCAFAATALAALAPRLLERVMVGDPPAEPHSTMRSTPTRISTAYTSRTGGVSARESAVTSESDMLVSVASESDLSPNSAATRDEC